MSLTGLINTNKDVKEFFKGIKPDKNKFYTLSGNAPFSKEYKQIVPYNLQVPYDSTLIGTAFDYLARFEIARNVDNNKQGAYKKLYNGIPVDGLDCISFTLDYNLIRKSLRKEFNNSLKIVEKYVNLEMNDFNILLDKSLFLARLEHFDRGGRLGAISTFKNMDVYPKSTVLVSNDFEYEKIYENNKSVVTNNIVSKEFIEVNGDICNVYFSYDDTIKVSINIKCYDKCKNLLQTKEIELDSFSKEFSITSETSFMKVVIESNESNIDINRYIRVGVNTISNEQCNKILSYFTEFNDNIKNELKNLFIVFKEEFVKSVIKEDSVVIFNPEFGLGSELVGGADADIFIDGVLYDFKSTKNRGYVGKDIYQIIGYYLLNEITKKCKSYWGDRYIEVAPLITYDINKVAFYKARFGEIEYLDISYLDAFNKKKVIKEFEKLLKKINNNFDDILKKHQRII